MIFSRLTLKNFKSYDNTVINFNKGISVIVGENGAGKSSIFEAISFALFKQHTAKKIDDLVRNGSKENMEVGLEFIANGKEYKIIREKTKSGLKSTFLKKTSSRGEFIPVCSGDKEVSNEIYSILNIDSDLFLNAIYIRQGEISDLVDKTAAEKKLLIGKLLGLDSLEKAWKNLLPYITEYENQKAELKGKLHNDEELNEDYKRKKDFLNSLKEKGHKLESQIAEVKELKEDKYNEKVNMEKEKENYETLLNNLETEKESLDTLEKDKRMLSDRLDEISAAEEKILRLEKFIKKLPLYLDFEKSVTSIQRLKEDEKKIDETLESIKEQTAIVEKEKEGYNEFLASEEKIDKLKNHKAKVEKELADITQLEQNKKDLIKGIEENRNEIDEFFSKARDKLEENGLSQEILVDVHDFENLEKANNKLIEEVNEKYNNVLKDINAKNEEIAKLNGIISSSKKPLIELQNVDNKCPLCQSDIDEFKKEELINSYNDNISKSKLSIDENNESIRLLTKNKDSFETKQEKLQNLSKDIIEYHHKFKDLQKDLDKLKEIDEGLEAKEYTNNKLGELILSLSNEESKKEEFRQSHDNYNKAKGALEVLGSETKIQYKKTQINNEIDTHVKNIRIAIDQETHLTSDINEDELKNRIDDLKKKEEEYNQLKGFVQNKKSLESQYISKKDDIDWKINKIQSIKTNIQNSKYDKDVYDKLVYSYEVFEKRHEKFSDELNTIKGQAKELIAVVNDLTEKIISNNKYKKEYENVNDFLDLLKDIRELYSKNGIQKDLRNRSRPAIQIETKKIFNQFNFNYSDLILDENYDVSLYGPEGEASVSMVSGGEKIAIALALRLGITQTMSEADLETILLDEPTIHLDSYRKNELINLLKDIKNLPQMIIVTHENNLEDAADHLIRVEKNNGISTIN